MKKFWDITVNIILILFLLIGIFFVVSLVPAVNYKILSVMSGSMEPTIATGAAVITWPTHDYDVNDVVTYRSPTSSQGKEDYTTHRIVKKEKRNGAYYYSTKGDANTSTDINSVPEVRIVGKVVATIPYMGYIVTYTKTLPGIVVIIVLATLIVNDEIKKIRKEYLQIKKGKSKKKTNNKVDNEPKTTKKKSNKTKRKKGKK